jgi:hypothetical protein
MGEDAVGKKVHGPRVDTRPSLEVEVWDVSVPGWGLIIFL